MLLKIYTIFFIIFVVGQSAQSNEPADKQFSAKIPQLKELALQSLLKNKPSKNTADNAIADAIFGILRTNTAYELAIDSLKNPGIVTSKILPRLQQIIQWIVECCNHDSAHATFGLLLAQYFAVLSEPLKTMIRNMCIANSHNNCSTFKAIAQMHYPIASSEIPHTALPILMHIHSLRSLPRNLGLATLDELSQLSKHKDIETLPTSLQTIVLPYLREVCERYMNYGIATLPPPIGKFSNSFKSLIPFLPHII